MLYQHHQNVKNDIFTISDAQRLTPNLFFGGAGRGQNPMDLCNAIRGRLPKRSPLHELLDTLMVELQRQMERHKMMQQQQTKLLEMIAGQSSAMPGRLPGTLKF